MTILDKDKRTLERIPHEMSEGCYLKHGSPILCIVTVFGISHRIVEVLVTCFIWSDFPIGDIQDLDLIILCHSQSVDGLINEELLHLSARRCARNIRGWLNNSFLQWWKGRIRPPIEWPTISPELNPIDFFLRG